MQKDEIQMTDIKLAKVNETRFSWPTATRLVLLVNAVVPKLIFAGPPFVLKKNVCAPPARAHTQTHANTNAR